jgi:trk system potassium uptake protein TrkA
MKVIICGAGQVGFGIARQLAVEQNTVTVVDQSADLIRKISDQLDVRGIVGHGSHPDILDRAGASDADMLVAVTFFDEVNMVACQVAHSIFNVPTKIARVRAQSYLLPIWQDLFSRDHMPIDVIISPELEVAKSVLRRLRVPGAFESISFADDKVQMIGVRLEDDCPIVNTPLNQLSELFPDLEIVVVGISREGKMFVPDKSDQMVVGDDVYFIVGTDRVRRALDVFGHEEKEARRIILIGGGNIGLYVAQQLEQIGNGVRVKIIEADKKRAERAADGLERTVVLHGDGLDEELLREAGVHEAEAVVALTNDDETNILTSLISKRLSGQRALTLVNNANYEPLIRSLGIDAAIDPRATTVSTILQHVRRGRILGLYSVHGGAAEVIEAEALETSQMVGAPLRDVDLPDGIIVGAIVRGDQFITPRGDTEVETGDRVVLFAQAEMIRKVEQLFRVSPFF